MGIYVGAKVFLIYEVRPGGVQAPHWWGFMLSGEWGGGWGTPPCLTVVTCSTQA